MTTHAELLEALPEGARPTRGGFVLAHDSTGYAFVNPRFIHDWERIDDDDAHNAIELSALAYVREWCKKKDIDVGTNDLHDDIRILRGSRGPTLAASLLDAVRYVKKETP